MTPCERNRAKFSDMFEDEETKTPNITLAMLNAQ
jgi:hypothetical protein